MMLKIIFLQHLYSMSDPELEDQLNDRLSFNRFIGLDFSNLVPDHSTIWRLKKQLAASNLGEKIFGVVANTLENKGLFLKKGTAVEATIITSSNRPRSEKARKEKQSFSQIDQDARGTKKRILRKRPDRMERQHRNGPSLSHTYRYAGRQPGTMER